MKANTKRTRIERKPVPKSKKERSIELRPEHINNREEFGHFEMDLVLGKKGKNKAAKEHFKLLNEKLSSNGINEKYIFHFLSPNDYEIFFEYLREDKLNTFISGLDNLLDDNENNES